MSFGGLANSTSDTDDDMGGEGAPSSWRVDATPLRDALHIAVDEVRAGLGLPPVTEAKARCLRRVVPVVVHTRPDAEAAVEKEKVDCGCCGESAQAPRPPWDADGEQEQLEKWKGWLPWQ
ncbi:hypothetical protein GUJ93_ZPchr0002g25451 [Zizania palustris]|uniref:Uncharacterized protein n=1 Tax=Zizania palustris TaxID=103762 RepID=A0A8J5SG02_ZIZPA|nr:hypothetical protein GUJ93_ZPchr0002g25451 [Zizania palustris]